MPPLSNSPLITAFPAELAADAEAVVAVMPASRLTSPIDFSVVVAGQYVTIPERVYNDEPPADALSPRQRQLLHCLYSRHHDGRVRQRHLEQIIGSADPWVLPFVVRLAGEYVLEILVVIRDALRDLALPGTGTRLAYGTFLTDNPEFYARTQRRVVSYWNSNHRAAYTSFRGYPGSTLLDLLHSTTTGLTDHPLPRLTPATSPRLDGYC
ncbi:hypothetical protein [Streptomyces sp. LaPpAH-108]|uniref:hypothetical protein n=1 Tax=Streptomyces sp. LaPpAH-108 TaxID=1155714 RepID=UPI00036C9D98|nr:hypothetical protein [Streptomyces sp. LaPpAH-108]